MDDSRVALHPRSHPNVRFEFRLRREELSTAIQFTGQAPSYPTLFICLTHRVDSHSSRDRTASTLPPTPFLDGLRPFSRWAMRILEEDYSTVTDWKRFPGLCTSQSRPAAMWYASNCNGTISSIGASSSGAGYSTPAGRSGGRSRPWLPGPQPADSDR